jgi:hypothetical protein
MASSWFALREEDGALQPTSPPRGRSKQVRWIERDLENLLALNPFFLSVEDHIPLRLGGVRGAVSSPDQAFVDELGRIVVVEAKKVIARLGAVSQAISYADHWRLLPPGEVDRSLSELASKERRAATFGKALHEIQRWAAGKEYAEAAETKIMQLGERALKRLGPVWLDRAAARAESLVSHHQRRDRLPFIGAPSRVIVIAPGFDDDSVAFAEELAERRVGIELVEVEALRAGGRVFIRREWVQRDSVSEPTWRLFRRLWNEPYLRNHFLLNGWADAPNMEAFSLSSKDQTDAKFWFYGEDAMFMCGQRCRVAGTGMINPSEKNFGATS